MKRPICLVGLLYLLLWALLLTTQTSTRDIDKEMEGVKVVLVGRVDRKTCKGGSWIVSLHDIHNVSWEDKGDPLPTDPGSEMQNTIRIRGVLCYFSQDADLRSQTIAPLGSYVMVEGICKPFPRAVNDGQFDQRSYEQIHKLDFSIVQSKVIKRSSEYSMLREKLWQLRCNWRESYVRVCTEEEASFFAAIVLGEGTELDPEVKGVFRQSGLAHLLAVSGMHISLLGLGVMKLLKRLGIPLPIRTAIALSVILSYGIMIDAGTSTIRAIIMFALSLLAVSIGRTYDMATALIIAACIVVSDNPAMLTYAGFCLSFGAISAIILCYPLFSGYLELCVGRELYGWKKRIMDAIILSFSISLILLPIQLFFYYEVHLYGGLLGVCLIPIFPIALYCAFAGGLCGMRNPMVGRILLLPGKGVFAVYRSILTASQGLPGGTIICGRPHTLQIILYYLLLCAVLYYMSNCLRSKKQFRTELITAEGKVRRKIPRAVPVLIALGVAILMICMQIRPHTQITFLDVGQGDGCVILSKSGAAFLVDAGSSDDPGCGERRLIPYLKYHGIRTVEYAFLSHPDEDHMNALRQCMEMQQETGVKIKHLILSAYAAHDERYSEIIETARGAGCEIVLFTPGDEIRTGGTEPIRIRCLFPYATEGFAQTNDQSLILKLDMPGVGILFTGDMGEEEETAFLDLYAADETLGRVDILKVAHHGSRFSTNERFLQTIRPGHAIISAGKRNRYGHPHEELLARLSCEGCRYTETSQNGAVTVWSEKGRIYMRFFLPGSEETVSGHTIK
ncbi:MAG: DNA internalization-related competence protein ComEC/Rec2 [Lachnospiraceae bacterium]|nr:DNA internalization-related competence protein ComEC/Rec2 [Lachnospiraceae bacterium]